MCRVSKSIQAAPSYRYSLTFAAIVVCLCMAQPVRAQWIGRKFMPKEGCVLKVGDRQTTTYGLPFDVSQVSGEWLWTGQGWVQKSKVTPLDEAASYYAEHLRNHPTSAWAYRNRAMAWLYKGELENALKDYSEAIRLDPRDSITYTDRGMAWYYKGEFDNALNDYTEAVRLDPQYGGGYNGRAWIWATSADVKYRDGRRAVESAQRACELSDWNEWDTIDTLAVAYAEAGDFVNAVKYGEQTLSMAPADKKQVFQKRLESYRARKPWREERRR